MKKKTHWLRTTLIVLIACGIAGLVIAGITYQKDAGRTSASASIRFSFDGAAEGKAPNGYSFDVSGITGDEVLSAALEAAGLQEEYTTEQVRKNMTVTGVYPENIAEQMTKYVSLLDSSADMQAELSDYRATQYSVVLYNDFDQKLSAEQLTNLLDKILETYREYFFRVFSASLDMTTPIADLPEYDYAQQLEAISEAVTQQRRYAQEMAELAPDFLVQKKGFSDIVVRYQNLDNDISRLNATITLNAVSRDRERLQKRYEMEIRSQTYQLNSLTDELKQIEAQVAAYEKEGIIYVSSGGSVRPVSSSGSDTYDKLVAARKEVTDSIASINAQIAMYQARLDDMAKSAGKTKVKTAADEEESADSVPAMTEAEIEKLRDTVEAQIQALTAKKDAVEADFRTLLDAYAEREINEKTVYASEAKYAAPKLLSGAFIAQAVKTAGPICAVGFIVCMVLLVISRRKEEKAA